MKEMDEPMNLFEVAERLARLTFTPRFPCATEEGEGEVGEEGERCAGCLATERYWRRRYEAEKRYQAGPEELCPGGCQRPTKQADGRLCLECRAEAYGL